MSKGTLILVVGLPGSGKGTLISFVRETYPDIVFPMSWTTRAMRPGEVEGQVYHFATDEEFSAAIERGEFLEWVSIDTGHRYGTLRSGIIDPLEGGKLVMREVEVQGARAIHELLPNEKIKTIFIASDTGWDDLARRMLERAPMSPEELAERKARYEREVLFRGEADYVIDNSRGNLEAAKQRMREIIDDIKKK